MSSRREDILHIAVASLVTLVALLTGAAVPAGAQDVPVYLADPDLAPTNVRAEDDPEEAGGDTGSRAILTFTPPTGEPPAGTELKGYRVYQARGDGEFEGLLTPADASATEAGELTATVGQLWTWYEYRFRIAALYGPPPAEGLEDNWHMVGQIIPEAEEGKVAPYPVEEALSEASAPIKTVGDWYHEDRTGVLIGCILFCAVALWYISRARKGRDMYIRPIAGMQAIDEAIGRATEMGKPILYVAGLHGLGSISTITSMTILGRVARRTAEYETPLLVPCVDPLVMLAAREIVREAYIDAGKPDAYREQDIFFVTDRQFAYVAGVSGIMMRERPAANLYMGYFYAESLILAETGAATGAIQIAGTDADTQIPFFVTACDYTLMGEELYAATAYLSREPLLLAQLKAQDVGKAVAAGLVTLGGLAATVAVLLALGSGWMVDAATTIARYVAAVAPAADPDWIQKMLGS